MKSNQKVQPVGAEKETEETDHEIESFLCPISQTLMTDPVMTKYGHLYERDNLLPWVKKKGTDPLTNQPLSEAEVFPAISVRNAIQEYKAKRSK